jgi:metal-responsive CopG/Arc/MetJ family transcriptional regulator
MRTTITIPDSLVAQVDSLVAIGDIKTRNQFIVEALEAKVKQMQDIQIDAQFAQMANDFDYIEEALAIEDEFAHADREVFEIGDYK